VTIIREVVDSFFLKALYNAEGVADFQPRVARVSALPWDSDSFIDATLKGLWNVCLPTLTEFVINYDYRTQGVALGWN
jgi:hypothetical protein